MGAYGFALTSLRTRSELLFFGFLSQLGNGLLRFFASKSQFTTHALVKKVKKEERKIPFFFSRSFRSSYVQYTGSLLFLSYTTAATLASIRKLTASIRLFHVCRYIHVPVCISPYAVERQNASTRRGRLRLYPAAVGISNQ